MAPTAPNIPPLAAIPPPGLGLYPGYLAHFPTSLMLKKSDKGWVVSYLSPTGGAGVMAFTVSKENKKDMVYRTTTGQEVMRIRKKSKWSGDEEYFGMRPDGIQCWYCKVHRGLLKTEFQLSISPTPYTSQSLMVQKKVAGQDMGIMWNGQPVATMSQPNPLGHLRREDVVNVAAGMDILLVLGMDYVKYEKEKGDNKIAEGGAEAGAAVAGV